MKNNTIIIIITYNNADLINRQVQCIKKFCKDQFDIVIIDNSDKKDVIDAIQYYNSTLKCLYYKTQSAEKDSSKSHCFAANFAYNKYKDLYKYFAFLDHDLFPVMDFSVEKILDGKIMAGIGQDKSKKYFWPGCLLFNNSKIEQPLIDFSTNQEFELDTGGNLYKVIEKYNTEEFIFFNEQYSQNPYFNKSHYNFYSMINNEMFMHFINGSNWNNSEHQVERINSLLNILEEKVK